MIMWNKPLICALLILINNVLVICVLIFDSENWSLN